MILRIIWGGKGVRCLYFEQIFGRLGNFVLFLGKVSLVLVRDREGCDKSEVEPSAVVASYT